MTGQELHLACDTCLAGDGPHYHPWLLGLVFVSLAVAALVWLVSGRGPRQVLLLGRIAATLLVLGPALAFLIVTSSTEGHRIACGANFSTAAQTGVPCTDHGTGYRTTAHILAAASVSGGVAAGLAAGIVAFRRRDVTDPSEYVGEAV